MTEFSHIRLDISDSIATITLARPEKLNAISRRMIHEILAALDEVDRDDGVRAVIVTGDGRAFCAGADLSRGEESFVPPDSSSLINADGSFDYAAEAARDDGGRISLRIYRMLKPVIGAINGAAVGLGATMTLAMDMRLANETARYGFVFARRGMVPEACSSFFLPRLVGISKALEWMIGGGLIEAPEMLEAGLVNSLHAPEELLPAARAIAHALIDNSAPVSVALTRQMLWQGLSMTHPMEAHRIESRGMLSRGRSKDAAEGVKSFLEKRQPHFPEKQSRSMPDYYPWWDDPEFR